LTGIRYVWIVVIDFILFEVIFLVYLAPSQLKEYSSVSRVVDLELLSVVLRDLWAVILLFKTSLE